MTKTVSCNLNLKELCYYQFHMWIAMKTSLMQLVSELFNTRSDCQWIVHSLRYLGTLSNPQASTGTDL